MGIPILWHCCGRRRGGRGAVRELIARAQQADAPAALGAVRGRGAVLAEP